jgi:hypothetical protein
MKRKEGVTMRRFAIAGAALALLAGGVAFAGTNAVLGDDTSRGVTTSNRTTTTTGTTTTEDRADRNRRGRGKGKKARRARAERRHHANRVEDRRRGFREPGEDIRGPCDEAEHANDPRCTGAARDDHDRSGRGRSGGDRGRSGSNSGPG